MFDVIQLVKSFMWLGLGVGFLMMGLILITVRSQLKRPRSNKKLIRSNFRAKPVSFLPVSGLHVKESIELSRHARLSLVEINQKSVLVAHNHQGVQCIQEISKQIGSGNVSEFEQLIFESKKILNDSESYEHRSKTNS